MKSSQSGCWICWSSVNGYCRTRHASSDSSARRRFLRDSTARRSASTSGSLSPSLDATVLRMPTISATDGAAIRMARQRERRGSITLDVDEQMRIRRHVAEYFSIVRRSEFCAWRESLSTSLSTTALNARPEPLASDTDCAISLMISCAT
eukprot:Amastigsp_a292_21.p3 type:complete len:150 gc:universal Amastigsp_a292_21:841-392(-)